MTWLETDIALGDDTDCETCGRSFNDLRYEFEPLTREHILTTRVGCYGGRSITTTDVEEAVSFLHDWLDYPARDELIELQDTIRALGGSS